MGLHLAKHGHEVKLLEMGPILSPESVPVHFRSIFEKAFNNQPGFSYELNAKVTAITENGVNYLDSDGAEHTIPAESVVLAAGMKARHAEAMSFMDGNVRTHVIGDCNQVGCVQTAMRAAYAVGNNI